MTGDFGDPSFFNEEIAGGPKPGNGYDHTGNGHDHTNGAGTGTPNDPPPGPTPTPTPKPKTATLRFEALEPIPITSIRPRRWAYGRFLLFGHAGVIGAVDGAGKGALAVIMALSMITGQALLGEKIWRTGPVAIISYEDDKEEWRRRIAVACMHYNLDYDTVCLSFYFITRPGDRITLAAQQAAGRGTAVIFPDGDEIIENLKAVGAVMLIVDPLNLAHCLDDGNSNVMVARLAGEISRIAAESQVAALVLHHLRKGSNGDTDDLMGAVALRATFRSARVLVRMTPAEALKLDVEERWRYVRIAGSKENYAPPPETAAWYCLESKELGNVDVDPLYPNGDNVQVLTRWTPPPPENLTKTKIAEILDALRAGPEPGERYLTDPRAKGDWAGWPIAKIGEMERSEAKRWLKDWIKNKVVNEGSYVSPKRRKSVDCLTLNETKAAEILGSLYRPPTQQSAAQPTTAPAGDRHETLDRIFTEIERSQPPRVEAASSEFAAWRVVTTHRPNLSSTEAQELVRKLIRDGVLLVIEGGLRLNPLAKLMRGIGE